MCYDVIGCTLFKAQRCVLTFSGSLELKRFPLKGVLWYWKLNCEEKWCEMMCLVVLWCVVMCLDVYSIRLIRGKYLDSCDYLPN